MTPRILRRTNSRREGEGLDDWKQLGYVSVEGVDRPGSKQMEYAADDYEIALLAKGLGKESDAGKYAARAENWRKLWDAQLSDGGVSGFIHPRHRDGSWLKPFTPVDSGVGDRRLSTKGTRGPIPLSCRKMLPA